MTALPDQGATHPVVGNAAASLLAILPFFFFMDEDRDTMPNHAPSRIGKMLLGLLFALIGIVLLGIAVDLALDRREFLARAQTADGVVSRLNAGGSHPEVAFITSAGEKVSYPQGGLIFGYRQDQPVRVRYLPERPAGSAVIDDPGALWGAPGFLGCLGLMFGVAGLANAIRRRGGGARHPRQ